MEGRCAKDKVLRDFLPLPDTNELRFTMADAPSFSLPLPMVDLQTQYRRLKPEIDGAIRNVLESSRYIGGPAVEGFAEALAVYLGAKHIIPCANGTDALQIALMALDLQPGDEVITTPFTFVATAEVIALLRLKPVFVDVDPHTFMLVPEQVEAALTARTRCIIPVHLFGQAAPMEDLMQIAERHGVYVVEDNAQALGADYLFSDGRSAKLGTLGTIGCTSFFPSKNLGAYGDGGAIFTQDDTLAERLRMIVNHGMKRRYYHDIIGVNSRLDALQAAILQVKLQHLDSFGESRRRAADYYDAALTDLDVLQTPVRASHSTHVFHQYTLRVRQGRDELQRHLAKAQISSAIYYPVPLHLQQAYRHYGYAKGDFPVSEQLAKEVLSLPIHTELNPAIQDYIIERIKSFFQ